MPVELPEGYSEQEVTKKAELIVTYLSRQDFESVNGQTSEEVSELLSAEVLEEALGQLLTAAGEFKQINSTVVTGVKDNDTYVVCVVVCRFENRKHTFTISLNRDLRIVGLYMS